MNFYDRSLSFGPSHHEFVIPRRCPSAGIFITSRHAGRKRERERKGNPCRKEVFSSERFSRSAAGRNARTSFVNLAVLNLTCKCGPDASYVYKYTIYYVHSCVYVYSSVALKRGSGELRKRMRKTRERTRRSCREFTVHTPVPPSQFVTDEAIGNKQRGDSNCLSFSAVVHWVLSSR